MPEPSTISLDVTFTLTFDPSTTSLTSLERTLRRESRRALVAALAEALARVEQQLVDALPPCARCGARMRSRGRVLRRLVSLFGTVPVHRARYSCLACGAVRQPLDDWLAGDRLGVYSRSVCEQALYLVTDLSFERAAEVLRHIGDVAMSGRQIDRVLRAESPRIAAALGVDVATAAATALQPMPAPALLDGVPPVRVGLGAGAPDPTGLLDSGSVPPGELAAPADLMALVPPGRFRRATPGLTLIARLRQLKLSGRWNAYWSRLDVGSPAPSTPPDDAPSPHATPSRGR